MEDLVGADFNQLYHHTDTEQKTEAGNLKIKEHAKKHGPVS